MDGRFSAERDEVGAMTERRPAGAGNDIAGEGRKGMPKEAGS